MVVRAVYIDIAAELTTDSFLQVLKRFSSVHGWPRKVFSDGGKQLLGASRELREQITAVPRLHSNFPKTQSGYYPFLYRR